MPAGLISNIRTPRSRPEGICVRMKAAYRRRFISAVTSIKPAMVLSTSTT